MVRFRLHARRSCGLAPQPNCQPPGLQPCYQYGHGGTRPGFQAVKGVGSENVARQVLVVDKLGQVLIDIGGIDTDALPSTV